jgi:PAS domain S-box-containing protein
VIPQRPPPGGAAAASPSLQRLADASAALAGLPADDAVGEAIVTQVAQVLQATDVRLVLFDAERRWLHLRYAVGPSRKRLARRLPSSDPVLRKLLEGGEPLLLANAVGIRLAPPAGEPARAPARGQQMRRAAALIRLKGAVLGYLQVGRAQALPAYTADDLPALQILADLAGLRLSYSQLAIRPRERERELSQLAPAWRPQVEFAGDFVIVLDEEGRIADVDGGACRLLGYSREELLQLSLPDISPVPPGVDEREALRERFDRARSEPTLFESSVRRRDDTLFPVRVQVEVREVGGRQVARGILWDLTEQKEAQARLLQTERLRILGQMASGVAHDLNNMLTHVLGNLQLLLGSMTDPQQRVLVERMQRAALDGAETVKRLHTFARSQDVRTESVDLVALVTEVAELMRPSWEALTQERGVPVEFVIDVAPVPPVLGNAAELREVLVNLVQNALDAMPQGGTVRLAAEATAREVVVTVQDTGVGMPPRVRSRIFDPFYTTKGPAGSGLGLSIAYTIIARHRGQISVESEERQGTTFTLRLPVPASALRSLRAEPARPGAATAPARAAHPGRILVVDDERDLADMLARILEHDGHQVHVCTRGIEAVELLDQELYDLLLTDVSMPDMDGWEVARRAKTLHPQLPVGLITGWGFQLEGVDLLPRGVDFVLSKPFTVGAARGLVSRVLALHAPATPNGPH